MAATINPTLASFTLDKVDKTTNAQGVIIAAKYVGPNSGSAYTAFYTDHPIGEEYGSTGAELYEIDEKLTGGVSAGVVNIELRYKTPDAGGASGAVGGANPVGYSSLESTTNPVEHPIEKKPPEARSQGIADDAWATIAADLRSKGTEAWIDPQPGVTRTDVVESSLLTMTENEIVGACGQVIDPSSWGVSNPSNNCWLMTGKSVSVNGETKTIVRNAQYNREGWNTQYVYKTGSETV